MASRWITARTAKGAALALAALGAVGLAGCDKVVQGSKPKVLMVYGGTIRPGATPDAPAAGYFTINGGQTDVVLRAVTADAAQRVEMHESVRDANGVMSMKKIADVPVPANSTVKFAPGGKHLMLWGINPNAIAAGKLPMVFIFSNNDKIEWEMKIEAPKPATADGATPAHGSGH